MVPPTESLRFVAGKLGKCGRNLEEIGAKFLGPNRFKVFLKNIAKRLSTKGILENWKRICPRLKRPLLTGFLPISAARRLLIYLNHRTPSGQSRVYRVTQLRTDGVHCRESAGTGPVNLKVVPNECCIGRSPWTN